MLRQVDTVEGKRMAMDLQNLTYFETSAKTKTSVDSMFREGAGSMWRVDNSDRLRAEQCSVCLLM